MEMEMGRAGEPAEEVRRVDEDGGDRVGKGYGE